MKIKLLPLKTTWPDAVLSQSQNWVLPDIVQLEELMMSPEHQASFPQSLRNGVMVSDAFWSSTEGTPPYCTHAYSGCLFHDGFWKGDSDHESEPKENRHRVVFVYVE